MGLNLIEVTTEKVNIKTIIIANKLRNCCYQYII